MISFKVLISLTIIVFFIRHSDAGFTYRECLDTLKAFGFVDENGFINFCHTMQSLNYKEFKEYLIETYPDEKFNEDVITPIFNAIRSGDNLKNYSVKLNLVGPLCIENVTDMNYCKVAMPTGKFFEDNPFTNIYKSYTETEKMPTIRDTLCESDKKNYDFYVKIYSTAEVNDSVFSRTNWCGKNCSEPPAPELAAFHIK